MTRLPLLLFLILTMNVVRAQAPAPLADSLNAALKAHPAEDTVRVKLLMDLVKAVIYHSPGEALRYSDEILRISEKRGWKRGIANGYRSKGLSFYLEGDYLNALDYLQKGLQMADTANKAFVASMYNNIALIYFELKQYDKALPYYSIYLDAMRKLGLKEAEASVLDNIGNVYNNESKLDSASYFYRQALAIAEPNNFLTVQAMVRTSMGVIFKKQNNYPAAIEAFKKSIAIARQIGNLFDEATALNELSEVYLLLGDYTQAESYAKEGLAASQKVNSLEWVADAWSFLARIYEQQHNYPASVNAYKNYVMAHDSLLNDQKQQEITRKDLQYGFDKKEALLTAENENRQKLANAEITRQRIVRNAIAGGAGLLILASLLVLLFYKRRKDAEVHQKEAEFRATVSDTEMMALRAQMNPHFIFNSLNSINDYISRNNPSKASEYLVKFAAIMRMILEHSDQKEISLADDLKALELYMQLEALRLPQSFIYEIRVDENIDKTNTLVPSLLLQPFVENSIWHGLAGKKEQGKITINIIREGEMIRCIVEDNGIGRSGGKKQREEDSIERPGRKSFGLKITNERIAILNQGRKTRASVHLSDLSQGTKVEVLLPLELNF